MDLSRTMSPIQVGPVTVPNRVARTGHVTLFSPMGPVNDALIDYHIARAKGGVGLSILEALAVHPSSALSLAAWVDGVVEGYRRLVAAAAPYGMKIFQQLWHGGHIYPQLNGDPPLAPSAIPNPQTGIRPLAMTIDQIEELKDAFVDAARKCREGGLHGVEVHSGHGYLIAQFLSPVLNQRTDRYGGNRENRMRFLTEVLEEIRRDLDGKLALGVRVSASSIDGVLTQGELREIVATLEDRGLIDFLNVSLGDYYRSGDTVGPMEEPAGYQLPISGRIAAAAKRVPRLVTGRFRTLEEVEQILREGAADLVSMVRAHIADPEIVRKTLDNGPERVRPCIACNQGCIGGAVMTGRMGCVVNPAVGHEAQLAESLIGRTAGPKHVLVIGGGPAGLEAARIAALRGHRVTLAEASAKLGGLLNITRFAPKLQTLEDFRQWAESEVYRLGVTVKLSTFMSVEDVISEGADVVILATGGTADMTGFQVTKPTEPMTWTPDARVVSPIEFLQRHNEDWGASALVFDDTGDNEAIACAEALVERGVSVTFVTRHAMFGPTLEPTFRAESALDRLDARDSLTVVTRARMVHAERGAASFKRHGSKSVETVSADTIVLAQRRFPNDEIYRDLRQQGKDCRRVGDALSPRDLQAAIREGHLAGRSIA